MSAQFESCSEMQDLIRELKNKREDIFGFVDPSMIGCGLRTDKVAPSSQKWLLKIEGVTGSKTIINPIIKYVLWAYESHWSKLSRIEKLGHIANNLLKIKTPTEEDLVKLAESNDEWEWGKLKTPEIIDMKAWLKAFGVDWADQGSGMKNILDKEEILELN